MTNRVPLPAGTALGHSYEYGIDVNLGTYAVPDWQPIRRISAFAPTFPGTTEDASTYDDLGSTNEDVTGRSFAASFTVQGNRSLSTGLYLRELEAIIAAARAKGEGAVLDVRFYHKPEAGTPNPNDAGRSFVTVEVTRQNTGNTGIEVYSVSFTGKGEYEPIENPWTGWGVTDAPRIQSVSPAGAGDGELVTLTGTNLLTVTAVTIDALAVEHVVVSASTIVATMPVGVAGPVDITVTNPAGTSAAFVYERGE